MFLGYKSLKALKKRIKLDCENTKKHNEGGKMFCKETQKNIKRERKSHFTQSQNSVFVSRKILCVITLRNNVYAQNTNALDKWKLLSLFKTFSRFL